VHSKPDEKNWEQRFINYFTNSGPIFEDASHDLMHFRRVYKTAMKISSAEIALIDPLVILAAAYFHDLVSLPKNHPDSKNSSKMASIKAGEILTNMDFPKDKITAVCHAIEAHSFSANIPPETLEAKIIQDADRMEALGALGILRTFYVCGRMGAFPYDKKDLHAENRPLNDKVYGLDHFQCKLFKLPALLQTEGGRHISQKRAEFLCYFVKKLEQDLNNENGGAMTLVWSCFNAGKLNQKLFNERDPFASNRHLEPSNFVVDRLMAAREQYGQFCTIFLSQLKEEL
jgi:uncharacterized protein